MHSAMRTWTRCRALGSQHTYAGRAGLDCKRYAHAYFSHHDACVCLFFPGSVFQARSTFPSESKYVHCVTNIEPRRSFYDFYTVEQTHEECVAVLSKRLGPFSCNAVGSAFDVHDSTTAHVGTTRKALRV